MRVGINGFGRIGRLVLRAAWDWPELEFVHINEIAGGAETAAHLLKFDSVQGRWEPEVAVEAGPEGEQIRISQDGTERVLSFSDHPTPRAVPWDALGVDLVLECSGEFRTPALLEPYFKQGVARVIVAAPVKQEALNIVMGINDHLYEPAQHRLLTAASCTTNCLAPVVKVIHENLGIRHGVITTIHNITNTQTVVDTPRRDLRRSRANGLSLIPTTTGSATAIAMIYPELEGKLNGVAVRVPLLNASLLDCVFEVEHTTDIDQVNGFLREAAAGPLGSILGYETRPLVSIDYAHDPRSGIVDAPSTMVIDQTQVKLLVWYDNEWGYSNRMAELARKVARLETEQEEAS